MSAIDGLLVTQQAVVVLEMAALDIDRGVAGPQGRTQSDGGTPTGRAEADARGLIEPTISTGITLSAVWRATTAPVGNWAAT